MSPEAAKPRFEPPPWEREAFDRFRREREAAQAATVEHAAAPQEDPVTQDETSGQSGSPARAGGSPGMETLRAIGTSSESVIPARKRPSDAEVEAMLEQLRREVPRAPAVNTRVVYGAAIALAVIGVLVAGEGVVLFAQAGANEPASMVAVATISFIMLAVGGGLVAASVALFRKYQRG